MAYLHAQTPSLIHRDLKSPNLLLVNEVGGPLKFINILLLTFKSNFVDIEMDRIDLILDCFELCCTLFNLNVSVSGPDAKDMRLWDSM